MPDFPRSACIAFAALLVAACSDGRAPQSDEGARSLLIRNVEIVDGTGADAAPGSVRVRGGRIVASGDLEPEPGDVEYAGNGLTLAPGFIDTHSHADRDLHDEPEALPVISQGITTVIVGQDGESPMPLAEFFESFEATPVAVNVASYVGHNTLRSMVLGDDFRREATGGELSEMAELLREELGSGALGLSTGLEYEPGIYSATGEVLALARLTAEAGGRYISHVRSEDRWLDDALDEIIRIGRDTGMPVQVSHIKLAMKPLWGEASRIIGKLDAAREEGVDLSADIYPYEYWQSDLMVLLPERDYGDRDAIAYALDQIAPPEGIRITGFDPEPGLVGLTLTEVAERREVDVITAFQQLAEEAATSDAPDAANYVSIIASSMHEDDIRALLAWPGTNVCTDGALEDLHPRARGAFPKVLGQYVRQEGLLSLEEAVHKMTGLSARHMGLAGRGEIRPGAAADLVLFDPATVADRATPENPGALSTGIVAVWVAGQLVFENGSATEARPGQVLRRAASR